MENTSIQINTVNDMSMQDIIAKVLSNAFLFFLIFGLSSTVDVKQVSKRIRNIWALSAGLGMQFIIMPLLGFLVVFFLKDGSGFSEAMGLALLVVTSSPGGSYSNWWCSLFNADLALSVAMTAVSTILSMIALPVNLIAYSHLAYGMNDEGADSVVDALNFGELFISLGIVISAIATGLLASWKIKNNSFRRWANRGASLSGIALILVSALLSSVGTKTNFWNQHWKFYVGVALPCLLGLSIANILSRCCRLSKPEGVSISVECCYQNTGIATSVAVTMFSNPEERAQALAVPLFYGLVEALVIGLYCIAAWKLGWTKAPADENFCVVISNTYENKDIEDEESSITKEEDLPDDFNNIEAGISDDRILREANSLDLPSIEEGVSICDGNVPKWQFWKRRHRIVPPKKAAHCDGDFATPSKEPRTRLGSEDTTTTGTLSA
mmetsp:Transcript_30825/g.46760  ORF Transcript_30825/g.46760 Transcript_30825/m.46760 type:complete len:439 (-) Transcript_30825:165-1481(-)